MQKKYFLKNDILGILSKSYLLPSFIDLVMVSILNVFTIRTVLVQLHS